MSNTHDLIQGLETQLKRLQVVHDEIGYSTEIKKEKEQTLLNSIATFIVDQVNDGIKEKENMVKEAERIHTLIYTYKKLMGEFALNKPVFEPNCSVLDTLQKLKDELKDIEKRYNERLEHVQDLYEQLKEFKLAMDDFTDTSMLQTQQIDVSSLAVNSLEEEIQRCEIEYLNRKTSIEDGVQQISHYFAVLGMSPETQEDHLIEQYYREKEPDMKMNLCHQLVAKDTMTYIAGRIQQLEHTKQQVELKKENMLHTLKLLWRRLHVNPQQCEEFLMSNRGFTSQELEHYELEVKKLSALRQERIGDFILTAREELHGLWDQLYYSDIQKQQFEPAFSKDLSDAVLEAHETEINRLQLQIEESKHILEGVEKHMRLKKEIQEFEAATRDPNRLFGKGQRDPGRLLREEKFRKRISRELPKVSKELEGALLEFEALKGYTFLVYGKPYFDTLYETESSQENKKPEVEKVPTTPITPKRTIESRRPMTSPRHVKQQRQLFNTPQVNRMKSLHLTSEPARATKVDQSVSVLHRVREHNIKKHKQKVMRREDIFKDDDDDDEESDIDEDNIPPPITCVKQPPRKRQMLQAVGGTQSDSDDNLDLGIFDDGPDLSDMSEIDA